MYSVYCIYKRKNVYVLSILYVVARRTIMIELLDCVVGSLVALFLQSRPFNIIIIITIIIIVTITIIFVSVCPQVQ